MANIIAGEFPRTPVNRIDRSSAKRWLDTGLLLKLADEVRSVLQDVKDEIRFYERCECPIQWSELPLDQQFPTEPPITIQWQ